LLSVNPSELVFPASRPLMTQVIILTALVMMVGTLSARRIAEGEIKGDPGNP
jgi:hypothetical protein